MFWPQIGLLFPHRITIAQTVLHLQSTLFLGLFVEQSSNAYVNNIPRIRGHMTVNCHICSMADRNSLRFNNNLNKTKRNITCINKPLLLTFASFSVFVSDLDVIKLQSVDHQQFVCLSCYVCIDAGEGESSGCWLIVRTPNVENNVSLSLKLHTVLVLLRL